MTLWLRALFIGSILHVCFGTTGSNPGQSAGCSKVIRSFPKFLHAPSNRS
jgi:hypothetical protein